MQCNAAADRDVIGVMTGTSVDGIDVALMRMSGRKDQLRAQLIQHASGSLGSLRERLRDVAEQHCLSAEQIAGIAWEFGQLHAEVVGQLLGSRRPDLVAVHGQTVFHQPPLSWQLINPAPIAARFGCPVVYDFRQADLAIGGQGAPITPAADRVLFPDPRQTRAVVNLGGFCNVSILPAADSAHGFDVCACNQVLDAVARTKLGRPFDDAGRAAMSGVADTIATQQLLDALRLQRDAARSLGTGDETLTWVERHAQQLSGDDLAASAVAAIAQCIAEALKPHEVSSVIVAGGGALNAALMSQLTQVISCSVSTSESLGIAVQAREAACMAVLGDMAFADQRSCSIAWPARQ